VETGTSFLSRDPDERIVRWGWVLWIAWLAVGGALLLGDYRGGVLGLGAVLAAPFWGIWALWALYRGARAVARVLGSAGKERNGRYYEFDGRRIRMRFDGDHVWFAAADVFDALGTERRARDPDRVRGLVGRDGLMPAPGSQLLCFSEKGLAAWLDRRTERSAARFERWVETQVVMPYRRRRDLDADASGSTTVHPERQPD
jgi:hypothetical protein